MNTSYEEETAPLVSRVGIPTAVRDNRQFHEKQLAVYIILASTLCERVAFYSLAVNMAFNLEQEKTSSDSPNGSVAAFVFSGK